MPPRLDSGLISAFLGIRESIFLVVSHFFWFCIVLHSLTLSLLLLGYLPYGSFCNMPSSQFFFYPWQLPGQVPVIAIAPFLEKVTGQGSPSWLNAQDETRTQDPWCLAWAINHYPALSLIADLVSIFFACIMFLSHCNKNYFILFFIFLIIILFIFIFIFCCFLKKTHQALSRRTAIPMLATSCHPLQHPENSVCALKQFLGSRFEYYGQYAF